MKQNYMKFPFFALTLAVGLVSCDDEVSYDIYKTPTDVEFQVPVTEFSFRGNATRCQVMKIQSAVWPTVTFNGDFRTSSIEEFTPRYDFRYNILPRATLDTVDYTINIKSQDSNKSAIVHVIPADPGFLGLGWNMGNQMEASADGIANETCWGNAACTQATMDGVKAGGFESVRIPVSWKGHIGDAPDYKIEDAWIDRVAEIVGYAQKAGLKAIINMHHDDAIDENGVSKDGGWINVKKASENEADSAAITDQIKTVWRQIATRFKDVPAADLMFESFNEVQDGKWGATATAAQHSILNSWNQIVVDVIRATGGENASRWIGVPGYAANPGLTMANLKVPKDPANKVAVAVHTYDPYNFCIEDKTQQWGNDADRDAVESLMFDIVDKYLAEGVQVYIGEFGCVKRADATKESARLDYLKHFAKKARTYGLSLFLWDNGANAGGKESHAYIDHGTGKPVDAAAEAAIKAIVDGYNNR